MHLEELRRVKLQQAREMEEELVKVMTMTRTRAKNFLDAMKDSEDHAVAQVDARLAEKLQAVQRALEQGPPR